MSDLTLAGVAECTPASAAELAARIPVPSRSVRQQRGAAVGVYRSTRESGR
jgi:hypothetical protein